MNFNTLNESFDRLSEKLLNEGPGAGYEITFKTNPYKNQISNIKIENLSWAENKKDVEVWFNCDFQTEADIRVEFYYYEHEEEDVKVEAHQGFMFIDNDYLVNTEGIEITLGDDIPEMDREKLAEIVRDEVNAHTFVDGGYVYGGGWSHSVYDGSLSDADRPAEDNAYGDIYFSDLRIVDEGIIDTFELYASGEFEEDEYIDESLLTEKQKEWSEEDKYDNEILVGIMNKLDRGNNAKLTPKEQKIVDKYGLSIDRGVPGYWGFHGFYDDEGNDIARTGAWSYPNREKINMADRARKIPERARNKTYWDDSVADLQKRYHQMKVSLMHRKDAQNKLDDLNKGNDSYGARLDNIDKEIARLNNYRKDIINYRTRDTQSEMDTIKSLQDKIDILLKKKQESLQESEIGATAYASYNGPDVYGDGYAVYGYYDEDCRALADSNWCSNWEEVQDLVHSYISKGDIVRIINNETGNDIIITPDEYFDNFEGDFPIAPQDVEEGHMWNRTAKLDSFDLGLDESLNKAKVIEILQKALGITKQAAAEYIKNHSEEIVQSVVDKFLQNGKKPVTEALFDYRTTKDVYGYSANDILQMTEKVLGLSQKEAVKYLNSHSEEDVQAIIDEATKHLYKNAGEKDKYWYFTRHGQGPGTFPRDATLLDWVEDDDFNTWIALDRMLTDEEMAEFELREQTPPDLEEGVLGTALKVAGAVGSVGSAIADAVGSLKEDSEIKPRRKFMGKKSVIKR